MPNSFTWGVLGKACKLAVFVPLYCSLSSKLAPAFQHAGPVQRHWDNGQEAALYFEKFKNYFIDFQCH